MGQKIETFLVDDLDGSQAESTIQFGLDGTQYEIDLSTGHASDLRDALNPYIGAGRKTGPQRRTRKPAEGNPGTAEIRAWARTHGIEVKDRGKVPADVVAQYEAATGS